MAFLSVRTLTNSKKIMTYLNNDVSFDEMLYRKSMFG